MVLVDEEGDQNETHPYGYAKILAIGHVMVRYTGPGQATTGEFADGKFHRMDVLRVRWYRRDASQGVGWDSRRLPKLSLDDPAENDGCGFLAPKDVIRGCHIMPAFRYGKRRTGEREDADDGEEEEYEAYLVGM